jgi:hypothetical protein
VKNQLVNFSVVHPLERSDLDKVLELAPDLSGDNAVYFSLPNIA